VITVVEEEGSMAELEWSPNRWGRTTLFYYFHTNSLNTGLVRLFTTTWPSTVGFDVQLFDSKIAPRVRDTSRTGWLVPYLIVLVLKAATH